AYVGGISTRKVDALVAALGVQSGISRSQVSRICQGHRRAGESLPGPAARPRSLPVRLPGCHLPARAPWPKRVGGVAGGGGGDRHQRPRLPRGARHCPGRQ
ncbi:MAG: hypothetical protein EBR33_13420, partial [Synechococcaceae bacterium WB4_1_0192]|nr:hypothetical protein [Synechococcaceae bacterium WB4_1_0192]